MNTEAIVACVQAEKRCRVLRYSSDIIDFCCPFRRYGSLIICENKILLKIAMVICNVAFIYYFSLTDLVNPSLLLGIFFICSICPKDPYFFEFCTNRVSSKFAFTLF